LQLGPSAAAAGENPRRADLIAEGGAIVVRAPDDGEVAIGRKRDRRALRGLSNRAAANQLAALLRPHPVGAREDPHRSCATVVVAPTHDGGFTLVFVEDAPATANAANDVDRWFEKNAG
jgi:hypothetical protein